MNYLKSMAFGAAALVAASFSTTASAKADSFGVYVGSNGFGVQVSDYGGGYYGGYASSYDPCLNYHYRREHRYCWNNRGYGYRYGTHPNYSYNDRWDRRDNRHERRWDRRSNRRDNWRDHDRRGSWSNNRRGHREDHDRRGWR